MILDSSISLFEVPTIRDPRGNLSFIQNGIIPFAPRRVSIDNIPSKSGALIPLAGEIVLDEGHVTIRDYQGIVVNHKTLRIEKSESSKFLFLSKDSAKPNYNFKHRGESWETINIDPGDIKVPFPISRVYYITNIPKGAERGGHSHFRQQVLITAVRGSFKIRVDDGRRSESVILNSINKGLLIAPEVWRSMDSFEKDTIALIVSSTVYDPSDYIYDYELFKRLKERRRK